MWSVDDCFNGNEKKGRKPVKEFVERVERYEGLKEVMLSIEGIVSGRSQHASSVIFYPKSFLDVNAMMKTTKGLEVTQFNANDGEYSGELKIDFLSISALGRIREAMELLLKDGKIEWQGSLKSTYDKYFHPDVLDLTSKEMYDMLANGEVFDAFQMSSLVAQNAMAKIKPETFDEVSITNTLIRLQVDGGKEQPVDRFIRYKKNINEWYKDMKEWGLNEQEMALMKKHLLSRTGICDTQEMIMAIIIDEEIANAGLEFANVFRKSIGKKDEKKIEKASKKFREYMQQNGHRDVFTDYILDEQFSLSYSYAFSQPHTDAYTLILMIEMNICYRYGLSYWQTSCINVSSGIEGDTEKSTDYGEVSKAVNSLPVDVELPDINKSELKFITKNNKVLYGLKPIIGLDKNTLEAILENRPFKSLQDYYERMVETKLTSTKKTIALIKAGAFDKLENKERKMIMADLVKLHIPQKEKITMTQLPLAQHIIPKEFESLLNLYTFRNKIEGRNKVPMNKDIEREFIDKYSDYVEYSFDNGVLNVDSKSFKKYYDKEIKPLKDELKNEKYAREFTKQKRKEYWLQECMGTLEEWEIDTILYNSKEFVINTDAVKTTHKISEFKDLVNRPLIRTNSRGFGEYELSAIVGVVVGYNNMKHLVQVLTEDSGVIDVKLNKKQYAKYQESTENDPSWWTRGNKIMFIGYKDGYAFRVRGNKIYTHPVIKIERKGNKYIYKNDKE